MLWAGLGQKYWSEEKEGRLKGFGDQLEAEVRETI